MSAVRDKLTGELCTSSFGVITVDPRLKVFAITRLRYIKMLFIYIYFTFFRFKKIVCYTEDFFIWKFVISFLTTVVFFLRASAVEVKLSQVELNDTDKVV